MHNIKSISAVIYSCCSKRELVVNFLLSAVFCDEEISLISEEELNNSHNCCDNGYDVIIIIISWTESSTMMLCMVHQACNLTLWVKLTEVTTPEHIQGDPEVHCRTSNK